MQSDYRSSLIVNTAKTIRTAGFGALSVILALYLAGHGFSQMAIGAILSATLIEDAIVTTLAGILVKKYGMRLVLLTASLSIALCGLLLTCDCPQWLIVGALVFGIVSPSGYEGGPFAAIEQAVIADNVSSTKLARAFSYYNLVGFAGAAFGALIAGIFLGHAPNPSSAYKTLFFVYACSGLALGWLYSMLPDFVMPKSVAKSPSAAFEEKNVQSSGMNWDLASLVRKKSTNNILWLAGLQCIDAFGGGFVTQSILSFWFIARYHVGAEFLGYLFFATNVLAAFSFFAAPAVSKRFGLLPTMVFTHLPCSLTLCLMPFLPTANLAGALLLVRSIFSSMDVPARQAFTMLLVPLEDRPFAAALTTSARSVAQAFAPLFSGWTLINVLAALPFVCAGALKSCYDIAVYVRFRNERIDLEPDRAGTFAQNSGSIPRERELVTSTD